MSNNAIITTKEQYEKGRGLAVYVHWNGGHASVNAFINYCKLKGYRDPSSDSYGFARLVQTICNFFSDGLSCGIYEASFTDLRGLDNGIYVLDGWEIVNHYGYWEDSDVDGYILEDCLAQIDETQPVCVQMGTEYFYSEEVEPSSLQIGDKVYFKDLVYNTVSVETVVGIGQNEFVNGTNVNGIPYVDKFCKENPSKNINNYLQDAVRKAK